MMVAHRIRTPSCSIAVHDDAASDSEGAQAQPFNPTLHGDPLAVFLSDNPKECPKCGHHVEDHGRDHLRYEPLPKQDKVSNCSECKCFLVWDLTRLQFVK